MAKKVQEITLFNNFCGNGYDFEETKKMLEECNGREFTDEQVWANIGDMEQEDWKGTMNELVTLCGTSRVIVSGTAGIWSGDRDAAMIFDNIEKAINAITKDCDYIEVCINVLGNIAVRAAHHDGQNIFEIRLVTERGENYFHKWDYGYINNIDEYELYEKIFGSKVYSSKVDVSRFYI